MSKPTSKPAGGVRTLEDLRLRCVIDEETGCWLWQQAVATAGGGTTPIVHLPDNVLPGVGRRSTIPAARAAWLLSGRKLQPGHVVWRQLCTGGRCINPAHCRAGTKSDGLAAVAATGRNRGKPERAVINAKSRASLAKPVELVRQAEALFAAGKLQKDVRATLGISQKTAAAIRLGRHPHSSGRNRVLRGASVFTLGVSAT